MLIKLTGTDMKSALIGFAGVIIAAIITGVFTLLSKRRKPDEEHHTEIIEITVPQPTTEATTEAITEEYNADDYVHNEFIPSLDELEKEDSDNDFAEGLAVFLGVDRNEKDLSLIRKGEE